jgi:hypothetical protein
MARAQIPPSNAPTGDEAIEAYLASERRARPMRLLKVGLVSLFFGLLCTGVFAHWLIHGGTIPQLVFAGPFLLLLGLGLSIGGMVGLVRAR